MIQRRSHRTCSGRAGSGASRMVSIQVALTNMAPMLNSKTQMTMAPLTVQCFRFISHLARPRGCGQLHKLVEPGCQVNQIQPSQKAGIA